MKKFIKLYNRWRYRRLYRKLFFLYAKKYSNAFQSANEAAEAFAWICGFEYAELIKKLKKPNV